MFRPLRDEIYSLYSVYSTAVTNEVLDASLSYGFKGITIASKVSTDQAAIQPADR
jgi:hypothetical protein